MAKGAYIGVGGKARKIKKGYIGVTTTTPIYEESTQNVSITSSNLSTYFIVNNSTYYFLGSGSTFTSNNKGVDNSSAISTWTAKSDMSAVSFSYSVSSESGYDKLTVVVKGTTVANAISGTRSSTWSGSLSQGDTISLTYTKDISSASGNDCGTLSAMSITTTVKTQVGTETKDVARKIKKAYIGVGGVARPCWSGGELAYYGEITPLSVARDNLAATTVGSYALFGGGYDYNSNYSTVVDAYNTSLVRSVPTAFSRSRYDLAATSLGGYALFGGGMTGIGVVTEVYNTSLTKTTATELSAGRRELAATTVGSYALFGGGMDGNYVPHTTVDAYNASLTRSTPTALSLRRRMLTATSIGNYALFGGGNTAEVSSYTPNTKVDAYNASLTRSTPTALSEARFSLAATSVGNYVLFGGGRTGPYSTDATITIDAYNASLTRSTPTVLSSPRNSLAATFIGDYALFGGGSGGSTTVVDAYDASLTRIIPTELSVGRYDLAAASVGNYALFGGGYGPSGDKRNRLAVVDAYTVA